MLRCPDYLFLSLMPHPSEVLQYAQKVPHSMWATIAIVGFIAFAAGLAFAKGVVQQIINVMTLAACAWAAWYVFMHRVQIFGAAGMHLTTNRLIVMSGVAAVLMFGLCKVGKYFLAAFGLMRMLGGLTGWKGLIVSIIPSGGLLWLGLRQLQLHQGNHRIETRPAGGQGSGARNCQHSTAHEHRLHRGWWTAPGCWPQINTPSEIADCDSEQARPQTRHPFLEPHRQGSLFPAFLVNRFRCRQVLVKHGLHLRAEFTPDHHRIDLVVV